jgi:hypothetical protein
LHFWSTDLSIIQTEHLSDLLGALAVDFSRIGILPPALFGILYFFPAATGAGLVIAMVA